MDNSNTKAKVKAAMEKWDKRPAYTPDYLSGLVEEIKVLTLKNQEQQELLKEALLRFSRPQKPSKEFLQRLEAMVSHAVD